MFGLSAGAALALGAGGVILSGALAPDAPDQSGINQAAMDNAAISKETLDWYKQIYAEGAPERAKASAINDKVANAQLSALNSNTALSNDYADYAKSTFRPLETGMVAAAQNYDTPERQTQNADKAAADVEQSFAGMQAQQQRAMDRRGVNPSSGAAVALGNQNALSKAATTAGAMNKARTDTELQGYARKMDAANLGRGLASSQATSAGVALSAGNSAVNNAGQTMSQSLAAQNQMGQGFTTAIVGNNSAGNLFGKAGDITNTANGQKYEMLGSVAGAAMAYSDKTKKKNIKPVSDEQALKAVEKTPVSQWDYKKGEGDGGHHTGPMAQEVNKRMGEQAGPGGKMIDLITLNGNNMAAIAALSRKVDKLAKKTKKAAA